MKIHIVKKGDTLYELSKKYNVPLQTLIDANPQFSDPNVLTIGQKVKIPAEATQVPSNNENIIHKHVVNQGDSLWKLSKAWGVTLKDMIEANPQLKNPNALLVGEVVNIPNTGSSSNENYDKNIHGNKTYTGPKENTAPKEEMTAPNVALPKQLPEIPNLAPLPNVMPNMVMPNLVMPNLPPMPNMVMPENIKPNMVMPENIGPNMMMPENVKPNMEIPENISPNMMMPAVEAPYGCGEPWQHENSQHPYVSYPVPAQVAGTISSMQYEKTTYYPGIVENSHYENCQPNLSWVSPYAHEGHHGENQQYPVQYEPNQQFPVHYEPNQQYPVQYEPNQQYPVQYEPNQQYPVQYEPNQQYPVQYEPNQQFPVSYEPLNTGAYSYNPCGCSQPAATYYAGADPMYSYPHNMYAPQQHVLSENGWYPSSMQGSNEQPNVLFQSVNENGHLHWERYNPLTEQQSYVEQNTAGDISVNAVSVANRDPKPEPIMASNDISEKEIKTLSNNKEKANSTRSRTSANKKDRKKSSGSKRHNPWIKN
ncbi:LysM peptidoglycan-binding domain-containing protein [Paenibacillus pini]|uniref:Spore peptidoglycan hydrolase n=1 Tax=Paenibacillus pini JCM 16418 TaxID=1236976 RepID=W7Z718_9BACL|nr:LysM peptidoglycan-binding domain-containing protein [Paenibacillus pini]GAF10064.1 spore peptidoglycan hydrolase [Paenibacillus pini JCM 16418]